MESKRSVEVDWPRMFKKYYQQFQRAMFAEMDPLQMARLLHTCKTLHTYYRMPVVHRAMLYSCYNSPVVRSVLTRVVDKKSEFLPQCKDIVRKFFKRDIPVTIRYRGSRTPVTWTGSTTLRDAMRDISRNHPSLDGVYSVEFWGSGDRAVRGFCSDLPLEHYGKTMVQYFGCKGFPKYLDVEVRNSRWGLRRLDRIWVHPPEESDLGAPEGDEDVYRLERICREMRESAEKYPLLKTV